MRRVRGLRLSVLGLAVCCLTFAACPARALEAWTPGSGWTQVWADEFDGTAVNTNNWRFELGGGGWGNNELQTYTSTNASVQNGNLVITATKDADGKYFSSRMISKGLQTWKYGKMAARIRLPYGQGIWPAFWMLGENISTVGWPRCGEIDIMELIGGAGNRNATTYGTLHWNNNGHQSSGGHFMLPNNQSFFQDYHVFEAEWNSTNCIFRLDGTNTVHTVDISGNSAFQQPFYYLLNLAVGGKWPGNPDATTMFPQSMYVDWVRVYQPTPSIAPAAPVGGQPNAQPKSP